jgi:nucleotide-binding universal stress UspA family protein
MRSALTDLVVVNLSHPPGPQPLARLSSGFHSIIHQCPRPVLAVPQPVPAMERVLLAFDGSPKAREALFVAAYLGEAWHAAVTVITVVEADTQAGALDHARRYLELHEVEATYVERQAEPVASTLVLAAEEHQSDLIIIGGYGASPMLEVVLGSAVDQVLREARRPVLICR